MKISINGKTIVLQSQTDFKTHLPSNSAQTPFALAINGEFVPRSAYDNIEINDGDEIDIVSPVGGG